MSINESISRIKVSVICPTFNCENYIRDTLLSILSQTHSNLEVIVIDDCSNDNTVEIVKSINDSRIRLFENVSNKGPAYSRNRGIKETTGQYIAFLDGDDLWREDKIEHQLTFMVNNNYQFTYTNYLVFSDNFKAPYKHVTGPKKISFRKFKKCCYPGCLTVMYKKDICPNLEIPTDRCLIDDYALWIVLSQHSDCHLLNEDLAFYRRHEGSRSSVSKLKLIVQHRIMFEEILNYNKFHASICAYQNAFYYILKQIHYVKKLKH